MVSGKASFHLAVVAKWKLPLKYTHASKTAASAHKSPQAVSKKTLRGVSRSSVIRSPSAAALRLPEETLDAEAKRYGIRP